MQDYQYDHTSVQFDKDNLELQLLANKIKLATKALKVLDSTQCYVVDDFDVVRNMPKFMELMDMNVNVNINVNVPGAGGKKLLHIGPRKNFSLKQIKITF